VVAGQCEIHLPDRIIRMREGDFLLLPRGQRHEVRVTGDGHDFVPQSEPIKTDLGRFITRATVVGAAPAVDLLCGHYSFRLGAGRILLASIADPLHVDLFASSKEDVFHLTALLRSVVESDEFGVSAMLDALAQVLLVLALKVSSIDGAPGLLNATDPAVTSAIAAVVAEPGAKWTAERLAAECHVSRATLVRRFRQYTGSTIAEFVTWVRVMRAADLLRIPGRSVASVSEAVGYSSTSAFSSAFQAAVGSPPGRFAREARG
jgi:AraC family transcriptional activator of mtrCDE